MEVAEFPSEIVGNQELTDRYVELSLRSYLLTLHEEFAQRVDFLDQTDFLSPDQRLEKARLERFFQHDTGVRAVDRRAFEQRIETSIANGCDETLEEILALFAT